MTPAGKREKQPTPEEVEAQRLADEEAAAAQEDEFLEDEELDVPAIGEAVTYLTVDPNSGHHEEHAALITYVGETGVDVVAFFQHARAGRPIQNVPFHSGPQEELIEETRHYWRYPQAAPQPESEVEDDGQ